MESDGLGISIRAQYGVSTLRWGYITKAHAHIESVKCIDNLYSNYTWLGPVEARHLSKGVALAT